MRCVVAAVGAEKAKNEKRFAALEKAASELCAEVKALKEQRQEGQLNGPAFSAMAPNTPKARCALGTARFGLRSATRATNLAPPTVGF